MSETPLFERLKADEHRAWSAYTDHPFVVQMGEGTLPETAFRFYLIQDYLFLIQFARAYALAGYKSRTLKDLEDASAGLSAILSEMDLHVRLCERWGLQPSALERVDEHQSCVAYTRFVLDAGLSGDLLDLHTALSPCVIGYAEIGRALQPALDADPAHPYRDWIGEYAGPEYQSVAESAARRLDRLALDRITPTRYAELRQLFKQACLLEAQFWEMGLA